ncbi:ClpXP protease specificity-enhancing factor [Chitinimonas sp. BJB300]|uniref:ClpXP protease specificity-enhancing factor n=1 Tax=Chitinimonas sp. BJB300 TaxID=1559339 RepID=UPI000C11CD51|nr:ClpXP protease specificity-enhancing factor [Chitinimonas sp. BJB300]PHV11289.1 ClpXP protease specificity-enhancing factor [Chitinimonas sp. BJB300]TSJ91560.1 ClpXP protease specificity-enhancing factor [Chitinimonas sp. BJB300]
MNSVPIKPYLMRAIHEWCSDHGHTPYLVAAVKGKMQVPMEFVKNGEIVLNVSYNATRNLQLGDDYVRFSARFGGVSRDIIVPIGSVVSLFSRETGEGMAWEPELTEVVEMDSGERPASSSLRSVVQELTEQVAAEHADQDKPAVGPDDEPTPPAPSPGRGHLRIVK